MLLSLTLAVWFVVWAVNVYIATDSPKVRMVVAILGIVVVLILVYLYRNSHG